MRIAIVAPTLALRIGLRELLAASPTLLTSEEVPKVVFEAATLDEYAAFSPEIDLLLITSDVVIGDALQHILNAEEERVAVLLLCDDPKDAQRLFKLKPHAWGVLPRDVSAEELQVAVRAVNEGLVVGTPILLEPLLPHSPISRSSENDLLIETLTERESQVLQLLARGLANKQIAAALGISEHTVKFHVSSLYTKLGATNRTEAVRVGVQRGLILL